MHTMTDDDMRSVWDTWQALRIKPDILLSDQERAALICLGNIIAHNLGIGDA